MRAVEARTATDVLLAGVARHGLPDAPPLPVAQPLDIGEWHRLRAAVRRHRLTGLWACAIEEGALPVTDGELADADRDIADALEVTQLLERHLLASERCLHDAGVELRVLKGPALAHTLYPSASLRCFGDIDLLVPSARYDDAITVLRAAGGTPRFDEPHSGFNRRYGKGVCILSAAGLELDIHRTLCAGPFGMRIDLDRIFAEGTEFEVEGRVLQTLGLVDHFLHACLHAALGDDVPRWPALRDIAQMLLCTELDIEQVHARAAQWRGGPVVARAVTLAWDRLELVARHPLEKWARGFEPTSWDRRRLGAYTGPESSYAAQAALGVTAVPGILPKLRYLCWLALPDREYLAQRDGTYLNRLSRGVRVIVDSAKSK